MLLSRGIYAALVSLSSLKTHQSIGLYADHIIQLSSLTNGQQTIDALA